MKLEKEMIRLFDDSGTEKMASERRIWEYHCNWFSNNSRNYPDGKNKENQITNGWSNLWQYRRIVRTRNAVKNQLRFWSYLSNGKPYWDCQIATSVIVTIAMCLILTLPQFTNSLPLPNPQLVVRSQSLLFPTQHGRQIDLTHKMPTNEVFWLNFEEGYFACQVNASEKFLKLFRLSRLCDGSDDCYQGTDELVDAMHCSNECQPDSTCRNHGVCLEVSKGSNRLSEDYFTIDVHTHNSTMLESNCICDDGYGGKDCSQPDVNECKFRPCSPFADCTNTLGSFKCECKSGYEGDGYTCNVSDENLKQTTVEESRKEVSSDRRTIGVASSYVPFNDTFEYPIKYDSSDSFDETHAVNNTCI